MKALLKLLSLKFITSILGVFYSILQVRYFGASRSIEVYFASLSLVYLITSLTQSGQLSEVFLPIFRKLANQSKVVAFDSLNIVLNWMALWGVLIICIVVGLAPFVVDLIVPGFDIEDKIQVVDLFRVLSPYLFLQVFISFFITVLNAESKFGRAEFLGLTSSLINILSLVFLFERFGVWSLVLSMLIGKLVEFLFYLIHLHKIGYKYKLIFKVHGFDEKEFFKTMRSTFTYVGATQIYSMVLTASISFLPEGIYAIFKYVQNLSNKVRGLFIQPFITIFFTQYNNIKDNLESKIDLVRKNFLSVITVNSMIIIGSILLGFNIINLIWGGNKFDGDNVSLAYTFLLFNLAGILFSSIGTLYRKMAVSGGYSTLLYQVWSFTQLLTAAFSYILIRYFDVQGLFFIIPLNTLLMGLGSFFIYYKFVDKRNLIKIDLYIVKLILIIIVAVLMLKFVSGLKLSNDFTIQIILLLATMILLVYPVISTVKIYKQN